MKIRLLCALVGLAIGFALPTFAQEQNTVDPQVRQEIEAVHTKFVEAFNKHDAAAIAALFTQNAVRVLNWPGGGTFSGSDAIENTFAVYFASSPPNLVSKPVQMYAIENEIAAVWEWSTERYNGHTINIYVRDADTWKIRMEYETSTMIPR